MSKHLWSVIGFIRKIREIDPEMPAQTILAVLEVYGAKDDITQDTLRDRMKLSSAAMARIAGRAGDWEKYPDRPGLGFISSEPDPYDRRFRKLRITEKGRRAVESWLKVFEKES